jgi:aryl-alcohol dehydrogenase-like predicted oxidoreductase
VADYLNARGLKVLQVLDSVAAELGVRSGQVALAWLAAQASVAAPIASATSVAQVEQLLGGMRLTLSAAQLARLNEASEP